MHVFISYSRKDNEFVQRLIKDLDSAGITVWIDQSGLKVGTESWERAIRDALKTAYALVLIASPDSGASRYVRGELHICEMYKLPMYPLWVRGEVWNECIPLGYIETQYADARTEADYQQALLKLINELRRGDQVTKAASPAPAPVLPVAEAPPITPEPDFEPRNPYKGLRAFTADDAERGEFFGRGTFIAELIDAVRARRDEHRFLAIVGPSGSGKSSVVMAGLLPALHQNAVSGSADWVYLDPILPGAQPLESLAVMLAEKLNSSISAVLEDLNQSERGLHLTVRRLAKGRDARVVIFVDQFEELFTQTTDEDQRAHFIDLLVTAAAEPHGQAFVLLTLRGDFYDRPMNYPALGKLLEAYHKSVLPMSLDDLRAVIEGPAALSSVQVRFEGTLVGDLLYEVRGQAGALPLLQFTLDQLFQRRQGRLLTTAAYQQIGGLRGALAEHAETIYKTLPDDAHRQMARALFLRLIEPGETEQDTTRRRASLSELITGDERTTALLQTVANTFINARLLTSSQQEKAGAVAALEVSHEALIREWARLGEWLQAGREDIASQQAISADAAEWEKRSRDPSRLYRGEQLAEAHHWAARSTPSALENEFIQAALNAEAQQTADEKARRDRELELLKQAAASAERAEAAERARATRFRRAAQLAGGLVVLAGIGIVLALLAAVNAQNTTRSAFEQATIAAATSDARIMGAFIIQATSDALATQAEIIQADAATQVADARNDQARIVYEAAFVGAQQGYLSTMVPRYGAFPPTSEAGSDPVEFYATRTREAALLTWTPVIQDFNGVPMAQVPPGCFFMGSGLYEDAQ